MDTDPIRMVLGDVQKLLKAVMEVKADVEIVKVLLETSDERVAKLEEGQSEIKGKLNEHETRLTLQETGTRTTNRILSWLLVVAATAVFGLLWSILTGQVTLVFS